MNQKTTALMPSLQRCRKWQLVERPKDVLLGVFVDETRRAKRENERGRKEKADGHGRGNWSTSTPGRMLSLQEDCICS